MVGSGAEKGVSETMPEIGRHSMVERLGAKIGRMRTLREGGGNGRGTKRRTGHVATKGHRRRRMLKWRGSGIESREKKSTRATWP